MHQRRSNDGETHPRLRRRGFSLIEIAAAMTLMGFLAAVAARFYASSAAGSVQTAVTAQTLQLELLRVRRLAIQTGEPHGLRFRRSGGQIVSMTPYRKPTTGSQKAISGPTVLPDSIVAKTKHAAIEFDAEGTTSAGRTIQLQTATRRWQLDIIPVTGTARLREL